MQNDDVVIKNLGLSVSELIETCRNHFDADLATEICKSRVFNQHERMSGVDSLTSFVALFRHESSQQEFLAFYARRLKEKISAKAECGCVHHAEECEPCEHDWVLVSRQVNPKYTGGRCLTEDEIVRHSLGEFDDFELIDSDNHMDGCSFCWNRLEKVLVDESITQRVAIQNGDSGGV